MRILITAGPTREYFDSVRFISNASSGRMGYAIAREAARRGHEVTLISGPVALKPPVQATCIPVTSADQMAHACKKAFRDADAAVMTAAVCDYRPTRPSTQKTPKTGRTRRVQLEPTEDIAAALGRRKGRRLLIGFAMEDHDGLRHAERKLRDKNCDLIVLNSLDSLGARQTVVAFLEPGAEWSAPIQGTKQTVARHLLRWIERTSRGQETRSKTSR